MSPRIGLGRTFQTSGGDASHPRRIRMTSKRSYAFRFGWILEQQLPDAALHMRIAALLLRLIESKPRHQGRIKKERKKKSL